MNLFELFVKIGVDDQASSKIGNLSSKLGNGLKTAAKIGTAAVGAASTAIVALTKNAVENYAEYEQLVGGAELMFGEAFDFVKQKSQEAYKTVQMSQNEYLKQVNGFATGLKTSLGGNEKAAAELADRIVTAEADIIAATGNTAENVQNAFNGIMKSNFTMLDNLQIGITPTKEGFQEVIDKVNDWNKANGRATKYQMGNLADMQNALVDYIDMVGMSGYASAEASKTIQGSLASAKGAWQNLLTGMADDEADFEQLINNLVETIAPESGEGGLINNLLPRIETALGGVSDLIGNLFPAIMEKIPSIIQSTLPKLTTSAVNIVQSLIDGITENQDSLSDTAFSVINTLVDGALEMLPQIVQLGFDLIIALAMGIGENLDTLIPSVMDAILKIVDTLTNPESLTKLLDAALVLITELAYGLIDAIPQLINACYNLVTSIVDFLIDPENLAKLVNAALKLVIAIGGGLISAIPTLLVNIGKLIDTITGNFDDTDWGQVGINLVNGLLNGLKKAWESVKKWFSNAWDNLIGSSNKKLEIHSPSRVFGRMGKFMALGVGEGWEDTFGDVQDDIENSLDFGSADYGITTSTSSIASQGGFADRNSYATQNVNVTVGIDETTNAMGLARALLPFLKIAEKEVYA